MVWSNLYCHSKHCFCVFCKSLKLVFFITAPNYYHVKISVDDHVLYFLGKVPLHYILIFSNKIISTLYQQLIGLEGINLYVEFKKMISRKTVIIIFLFPMNISSLVNLSDGLRVCLGMCSLFMRAAVR